MLLWLSCAMIVGLVERSVCMCFVLVLASTKQQSWDTSSSLAATYDMVMVKLIFS